LAVDTAAVGDVLTYINTDGQTAWSAPADGSPTNELQTIDNASTDTTHTVTLSNSGGSFQVKEGANIALSTSGTGLNGVLTISSTGTDTSGHNIDFYISNDSLFILDGAGPLFVDLAPYLDNTDTSGYNLDLYISGDTLYIEDGDGQLFVPLSVTNEAWTIDADDADTELITNQTVKFEGAGTVTTDYDPGTNTLLITGTSAAGLNGIYGDGTATSGNDTLPPAAQRLRFRGNGSRYNSTQIRQAGRFGRPWLSTRQHVPMTDSQRHLY
jgi:hypothetical protein